MKAALLRICRFLCIGSILLILSNVVAAQTISEIKFLGLSRTKYSYLRDYIVKSKVGEQLDSSKVNRDVQEIYNLRHFTSVKSLIVKLDSNTVSLNFLVVESFSVFPVLDLGLTKDFFKIQAGAVDFNTFGRSGNTSLYVRRLGRMTYLFNGDYPFLLKGKHGLAADFNKVGTYEPIFYQGKKSEFSYDLYTFLVMHRYDFNLHAFTKIGFGYQYEVFKPHLYNGLSEGTRLRGNAQRLMFRANYRYTKVNLDRINQNGYMFEITYNQIFSDATPNSLYGDSKKLLAEMRYYFNLNSRNNVAIRLRAGIGKSAFFDQFVLDDNTNIRGIGFKNVRRNNEFVINLEGRKILYAHRLGIIQGAIFNDFTYGYNFVGAGIRTYLEPIHGVVIRCDYGFNSMDIKQGGVVAGIHQYF